MYKTALCLIGFLLVNMPGAQGGELEELLRMAVEHNPKVAAARHRVEQALLKHSELLEFFDASLFAAVGASDNARALPLSTGYSVLGSNSTDLQAGAESALIPGAYVAVGMAQRQLRQDGADDFYQTLFGIRLRVPLLRDRGFAVFGYRRSLAMAEYNQRVSDLLAQSQAVRHQVEVAYIGAYETLSAYQITQAATLRFTRLNDDARELTRLKTIPDYEVFSTERELQIGRDDEEKARNNHSLSLLALATAIGVRTEIALKITPEAFFAQAGAEAALTAIPFADVLERKGEILAVLNQIEGARANYARYEEEMKDEVFLNAGLNVQFEDKNNLWRAQWRYPQEGLGSEVTLVWNRPLDYHGAKTRMSRFEYQIAELKAELEQKELVLHNDVKNAELNYRSARLRVELVRQGMEAARQTVEAEQERFRLGEGASKDVLDAQKNLTILLQRLTAAAADLLRAKASYDHAVGYPPTTAN